MNKNKQTQSYTHSYAAKNERENFTKTTGKMDLSPEERVPQGRREALSRAGRGKNDGGANEQLTTTAFIALDCKIRETSFSFFPPNNVLLWILEPTGKSNSG